MEANQAAEAQYGFRRDELLTMTLVDFWPREDVERNTDLIARSPSPVHAAYTRIRSRDGLLSDAAIRSLTITLDGRA